MRLLEDCSYPEDVRRIVHVLASQGYFISPSDAEKAWEEYSESICAGWLFLPDKDVDLISLITPYLSEGETCIRLR